jgi:hypothetical protein
MELFLQLVSVDDEMSEEEAARVHELATEVGLVAEAIDLGELVL